ncbi:MAG: nucleotide excision repair endonuclease, partial [Bdellovibrionales bacterium]|nr:nucleotide excision repair endonuclease [Bdellovibrionales bacterium]
KDKAKKAESFQYRMERDKRLKLPDEPGVYKMLSQDGTVLYVGKATSLKTRVNSYFRGISHRDRRKLEMMAQVWDIQVTTCATPLEAALLESDEIKKLKPRYNVALRGSRKPIFFLARDLTSLSTEYDSVHRIGPIRSMERLEQVQMVWGFLQSGEWGQPFFDFVEPTLIQSGWSEFCERHSIDPKDFLSLRDMVACGTWLWRKKKMQADEVLESECEAAEDELSASDVADKFERMFIGAAHTVWRAQRMWKLFSAKIRIRDKSGKESQLFMVDGILTDETKWKEQGHPRKSKPPVIDSAIYDRLSILFTGIQSSEFHKVESFI